PRAPNIPSMYIYMYFSRFETGQHPYPIYKLYQPISGISNNGTLLDKLSPIEVYELFALLAQSVMQIVFISSIQTLHTLALNRVIKYQKIKHPLSIPEETFMFFALEDIDKMDIFVLKTATIYISF
ncbi:hypothetical protein ACJX0J_027684, partial [Zea mays]